MECCKKNDEDSATKRITDTREKPGNEESNGKEDSTMRNRRDHKYIKLETMREEDTRISITEEEQGRKVRIHVYDRTKAWRYIDKEDRSTQTEQGESGKNCDRKVLKEQEVENNGKKISEEKQDWVNQMQTRGRCWMTWILVMVSRIWIQNRRDRSQEEEKKRNPQRKLMRHRL